MTPRRARRWWSCSEVRIPVTAAGVLAAALGFAACSDSETQGRARPTITRGDTLVVSIDNPIHSRPGILVTDWTIGGPQASQETAFSFVTEIAVTRDGAVFVNEFGWTQPIRRFDRTGRYTGMIGRSGQGPGEYFYATGVKELRDGRVALRDMARRLVHLYSATGEPDTTWRIPTVVTGCIGAFTLLTDTAGFLYVRDGQCSRPGRPAFDGLIRLGERGTLVDSIPVPKLDYVDAMVALPGRGEIAAWSIPVPFAPRTQVVWSPLGYFVTGVPTSYTIDLRVPRIDDAVSVLPVARRAGPQPAARWASGHPVISLRRASLPIPVHAAEREEQKAIVMARGRQRDSRWDWDASVIPTMKPTYRALHLGEDGRIWVLLSSPATKVDPDRGAEARGEFRDAPALPVARWVEPDIYDILEPDGRYVGQVQTPRGFELYATRGDTLWGSSRLADDVPVVQRLHIVWP